MSTPDSSSPDESTSSVLKSEKPKSTNGECVPSTKFVLRPSALTAQTEKLKLLKPEEKCPTLQSDNCFQPSPNKQKEPVTSSSEATTKFKADTDSKVPGSNLFQRDNVTQFSDVFATSSSTAMKLPENTFPGTSSDDSHSDGDKFVFGRNLHERAANYEPSVMKKEEVAVPTNQTLTFEEAAKLKEEKALLEAAQAEKSLMDSAMEYEKKRTKMQLNEVDVVTGEEEESNVLQANCKLFAFDKTKMSWQEKGRGCLRLNDREVEGVLNSRLIMRVQGSLKVILNTKVWSSMKLQRPSLKTIQLTAMDSEGVNVYLVQANPNDVEHLYNALNCRILSLKHREVAVPVPEQPESTETGATDVNVPFDTSSNDSFESSPRKRFKPVGPEDGSADSSTENITTEGTYDASSENSTDSTDGVKPFSAGAKNRTGKGVQRSNENIV